MNIDDVQEKTVLGFANGASNKDNLPLFTLLKFGSARFCHTNTLLLNYAFNTLQTISSIPFAHLHCNKRTLHPLSGRLNGQGQVRLRGYVQDNLANHLQHMQRDNALTLKVAMSLFIKSRNRCRMHFTVKNILVSISSIGSKCPSEKVTRQKLGSLKAAV